MYSRIALHRNDVDEAFHATKIVGVASVERQVAGKRSRSDQQVDGPGPPSLATLGHDSRKDAPVSTCGVSVERKWIERCFGALQAVLSATSLVGVGCRMWPGREFSQAERADGNLDRKSGGVNLAEVDENGRVEKAPPVTPLPRHEASGPAPLPRQDPRGTACSRP